MTAATKERKNPPVRLSEAGRERLDRIASEEQASLTSILDRALEALEEKLFWTGFNQGYAEHGAAIKAEVAYLDNALGDGLPRHNE